MKSPLTQVKEQFGDKSKLVAAVEKFTSDELWVARINKAKGLAHVSNSKLLKLHATFSTVKERFGTRAKLIDAICELEKRKDPGYRTRLEAHPVPRLWDHYRTLEKRTKKAGPDKAKATAGAKAKAPATKTSAKAAPKKAAASGASKSAKPAAKSAKPKKA